MKALPCLTPSIPPCLLLWDSPGNWVLPEPSRCKPVSRQKCLPPQHTHLPKHRFHRLSGWAFTIEWFESIWSCSSNRELGQHPPHWDHPPCCPFFPMAHTLPGTHSLPVPAALTSSTLPSSSIVPSLPLSTQCVSRLCHLCAQAQATFPGSPQT